MTTRIGEWASRVDCRDAVKYRRALDGGCRGAGGGGGAGVGGGRAGGQWFGSGGAHQQFDGDQHGERKVRPSSVGRDSMALRGESASWTDPLRVPAIKPCGSAISGVASDGSSVV